MKNPKLVVNIIVLFTKRFIYKSKYVQEKLSLHKFICILKIVKIPSII